MKLFPRGVFLLVASFVVLAIAACREGNKAGADPGIDALIYVQNAQFFREAMPVEETGPKIVTATFKGRVLAGALDEPCSGDLEAPSTAIAVGLASDVGYWIVPAGTPGAASPTAPTFKAVLSFSKLISPGPHNLVLRAVDRDGHFGPATVKKLDVVGRIAPPQGRLVVSLRWDSVADLDLHVVLPSGVEIFKRNRTEYQRPPASAGPVPPNAPTDGGVLTRDSNAMCVTDGQREEDVVWTEAPPQGHYVVRVDTFSLCGISSSQWKLDVMLDGARIGAAQGTSTENDLRFDHNRGGGVLAVEFDVP